MSHSQTYLYMYHMHMYNVCMFVQLLMHVVFNVQELQLQTVEIIE
jgi:hypothetical protein